MRGLGTLYWDLLEELIQLFHPAASVRKLRGPVTDAEIEQLSASLGFGVPESIVSAWREHDGTDRDEHEHQVDELGDGVPFRVMFDLLPVLLPIHAMAAARAWLLRHWSSEPGDPRFFVPILGELGDPWWLCVDASTGGVIEIELEEPRARIVAPTLSVWFRQVAEELATRNGFRLVDGRPICVAPEMLQVRRWNSGTADVGPEVIQYPSHASLDEWNEGKSSAQLVIEFTRGLQQDIVDASAPERALAVGSILRCEVARASGFVVRFAVVESAGDRLRKLEEALAPWLASGLVLPRPCAEDLLALRWSPEAAAAAFVARHGPVLKEPWGPPILRDTLAKLPSKLDAWRVPQIALDRDVVLDEASRAARLRPGTLFVHIQAYVFTRCNRALAEAGDVRRFFHVGRADAPLDDAWMLIDARQAQELRTRLRVALQLPDEAFAR